MIEYLILAPLDLEIKSLLAAFGAEKAVRRGFHDGTPFFELRHRTSAGALADIRIAQLKHQGVLHAAVTACLLIEEWHPACVISFGIAGGFVDTGDVALEDVVVAEHVFYYEPAKESVELLRLARAGRRSPTDEPARANSRRGQRRRDAYAHVREARLIPFQADPPLISRCRSMWTTHKDNTAWTVHFGPMASGEKLLADIDGPTRKAILKLNSKMLAVDMEAAGVAAATNEARYGVAAHRFLAIKGISDNASTKKRLQKNHRAPAAQNAASLCRLLIESLPVEDDFHRLPRIDIHTIRSTANEICQYVGPLIESGHQLLDDQVAALLLPGQPTPVFYHWTADSPDLHWVDFRFLLVLRRLKAFHLDPRILISDHRAELAVEERAKLEKAVRAILGDGTPIHWYRDVQRQQETFGRYAASRGLTDDVLAERLADDEAQLLRWFWIKFIGWDVRWINKCMLVQWHRQANAAKWMSQLLVLRSVLIPTSDINLAGGLGKREEPGSTLVIEPPGYDSILNWLETGPDEGTVQQLADHLFVDRRSGQDTEADLGAFVKGRPLLAAQVQNVPNGSRTPTHLLLQQMVRWNSEFFGGTYQ